MTFSLVACFGDPARASTLSIYCRPASLDVPAPRGEVLLCPLSAEVITPVVVVDSRLGGDPALLVVHTDEPVGGPVESAASNDPAWRRLQPMTGLRGEALGVIVDDDADDLMPVHAWPSWSTTHAPGLIAMGLLPCLPALRVDGVPQVPSTALPAVPTAPTGPPADVVNIADWRSQRST